MSLTGLNRTSADAVLKEYYLPGIRGILNDHVFLLSQIETNSEDIEGRRAVLAINTGRNQGIGARGELATLPEAGHQQYNESRVQLKYNYGRIQLSGPVMRSMGSDRGSFTRALQSETQGVVRDLRNDVNRQAYADGSGTIAVVSGVNTAAVVPLANASVHTMRQFGVGMRVDIGPAGSPSSKVANGTVVNVDIAGKTITLAATPGSATAADDIVSRAGSYGTGAAQKEITGLKGQIADSGALWNIDPATTPNWASYVMSGAGAVGEDMFIEASQEVNLRSGEQIDLWITTAEVHRGMARTLTSIKRFPNTNELRGGYSALDMSDVSQGNTGANTVSMFYDKDMVEDGAAYGLTTRRFQCYKMSDWEFMQEDGSVLLRVPNTDAYEGTLFCYMEMATDGRNAHCKVEGITTS